jgi:hypothetical protein
LDLAADQRSAGGSAFADLRSAVMISAAPAQVQLRYTTRQRVFSVEARGRAAYLDS